MFLGYTNVARKNQTKQGTTVVKHKEYIKDITGTSTYNVEGFDVQPGDATVFPWLAGIARSYQQYKIKSMDFIFRSTSADSVSAATNLGSVMLVHECDPSAGIPQSKSDILTMAGVRDTKPSLSVKCSLDVNARRTNADNTHYIRAGDVPDGASKKEYDYGTFYLATAGCATNVIGELWVVYEIELLRPQQNDDLAVAGVDMCFLKASEISATQPMGQTDLDPATLPKFAYQGMLGSAYRVTGSKSYISGLHVTANNQAIIVGGEDVRIGRRYALKYRMSSTTAEQCDAAIQATVVSGDNITIESVAQTRLGNGTLNAKDCIVSIIFKVTGLNTAKGNPQGNSSLYANGIHWERS